MVDRITRKDLEIAAETFNKCLKSDWKIHVGYRYGYTAIDLMHGGKMHSTLRAGLTKKEAFDFIQAMFKGIDLYTRDKEKVKEVI